MLVSSYRTLRVQFNLAVSRRTTRIPKVGLYAGTWGGGVFKSTDSGGNWSEINTGLTNIHVLALAIDPQTPTTLYAGTDGGGVFSIRQSVVPSFTSTPVTTAMQGAFYSYDVATDDPDLMHGDALTITAPTLPTWLALVDYGNGAAELTGTPTNTDVGAHSVALLVTDSTGLTDAQMFTVTVEAVEPTTALLLNYTVGASGSFFSVTRTDYPVDSTAINSINSEMVSVNPSATVQHQLKVSTQLRTQDGRHSLKSMSSRQCKNRLGYG